MKFPSQESIEKIILDNYIEYQYLFIEFQSKFLSSLHSRYQDIEHGNLVLYYTKLVHQDILRKKDYDLSFNLSFEKFWENHREVNSPQISITKIAKDTYLPKETVRRKISQLIKQNVLSKKNRNIGWFPSKEYKKNYNLVASNEIEGVVKLVSFICKKLNDSISVEIMTEEIKKNFSFYWFHYLRAQLEYLKLWSKQLNDLELGLIFLQVAHLFESKVKEKQLFHKNIYENPDLTKEYISASISATSVADVTGIPRATCVRKLEFLVKLKVISKNKISKRYYIIPSSTSSDWISTKITGQVVKVFSEFFFICLRAINART